MIRIILASVLLLVSLTQNGFANASGQVCFTRYEFFPNDQQRYKGKETLRFFVGEVIAFNRNDPKGRAIFRVMRDYGALKSSSKLIDTKPSSAMVNVSVARGGCSPINELKEGDVGTYAVYLKDNELWLASYNVGF
jgi:hypothetical protein